jgi:hypothetical protein
MVEENGTSVLPLPFALQLALEQHVTELEFVHEVALRFLNKII